MDIVPHRRHGNESIGLCTLLHNCTQKLVSEILQTQRVTLRCMADNQVDQLLRNSTATYFIGGLGIGLQASCRRWRVKSAI